MDGKLNEDEIRALHFLAQDNSSGDRKRNNSLLPERLFAFNLVARDPSGLTTLTKHGERTLFHYTCVSGLAAMVRGELPTLTIGAVRWLRSSGFIENSAKGEPIEISARGRLWLASLELDDAPKCCKLLNSEDFARRRSCGNGEEPPSAAHESELPG